MSRTVIETSLVEGIPVLTIAQEDAERCPLVFFVHGFMSSKEQGLAFGYQLARLGFLFVSFDAAMHGDRFDQRLGDVWNGRANYIYPFESGLDAFLLMHEIIVLVGKDLAILREHFSGTRRADASRIGLTGFSMGGFATFYAAATNPDIGVAVPIAGIPAFGARWRDVVLEASAYEKWAEAMRETRPQTLEHTAFMEAIDPFDRMASFYPRPLMMVNGDKDLDSPKKYSVDLYRQLKPLYSALPDRLRFAIHDDAGHQLTSTMIQEACAWFRRYLLEQEGV